MKYIIIKVGFNRTVRVTKIIFKQHNIIPKLPLTKRVQRAKGTSRKFFTFLE